MQRVSKEGKRRYFSSLCKPRLGHRSTATHVYRSFFKYGFASKSMGGDTETLMATHVTPPGQKVVQGYFFLFSSHTKPHKLCMRGFVNPIIEIALCCVKKVMQSWRKIIVNLGHRGAKLKAQKRRLIAWRGWTCVTWRKHQEKIKEQEKEFNSWRTRWMFNRSSDVWSFSAHAHSAPQPLVIF